MAQRRSWCGRLRAIGLLLPLAWPIPATASADCPADALVVVVESSGADLEPEKVRDALAVSLERPILSLLDAEACARTQFLSVAAKSSRHATVVYQPDGHHRWAEAVAVDGEHAYAAITRATENLLDEGPFRLAHLEVRDPWKGTATEPWVRWESPGLVTTELIDPFPAPPEKVRAPKSELEVDEVVDPWGGSQSGTRAHGGQGNETSRRSEPDAVRAGSEDLRPEDVPEPPRGQPGRRRPPDPAGAETGEALGDPRPRAW